jgi:hypothetical protein
MTISDQIELEQELYQLQTRPNPYGTEEERQERVKEIRKQLDWFDSIID